MRSDNGCCKGETMRKTTLPRLAALIATGALTLSPTPEAALIFPSQAAPGATRGYGVEKTGSEIKFQVKSRLKVIEGVFENWKAQVDLDPARLEALQLGVQAQSASIKTGNLFEETLIRGENFFAAEKHPEVSVASKKIATEGAGRFRMDAELTLRGVTHPVVIPFALELTGEHEAQMRGEFEFNRKDFGITYNMTLNPIEDLVKVIVTLKVREQGQEAKQAPNKN
jgi:polyisoprenoid-binding protein YceI